MKIYWMQPGEIDSVSGGYIYNRNIIEGIRAQSIDVELFNPGIDFPFPSKASRDKCREFFQKRESQSIVVVDSLILGSISDLIKKFAAKFTIVGIIHLPLSLSPSFTNDVKKRFKQDEIESFNYSKILIVTSEYSKSEIVKMGITEAKIHVVTPGINSVIEQRNYPEKPKNLICVSNISSSKGQLDLVIALENLRQFDWKLTFCGGYDEQDEYYKKIRHRITASGMDSRIVFTGEISPSETEKYYKEADLFILTSYFETYSMVVQEAMAFKLPIIAANSGAVAQTASSLVAKFYNPGDTAELEKQLLPLLTNKIVYYKLIDGFNRLNLNFLPWSKKAVQFLHIVEKYYAPGSN